MDPEPTWTAGALLGDHLENVTLWLNNTAGSIHNSACHKHDALSMSNVTEAWNTSAWNVHRGLDVLDVSSQVSMFASWLTWI